MYETGDSTDTAPQTPGVNPAVIREHLQHLQHSIDAQSIPIRAGITFTALATVPLFGAGVREFGTWLGLGQSVLPLLVIAHVPAVIAIIAVWSIGCDICRTEGTA